MKKLEYEPPVKTEILKDISNDEEYIEAYKTREFYNLFKSLIDKKIEIPVLINRSGIDSNRIYKILDNKKCKKLEPEEIILIGLCIPLKIEDTNRLLESYCYLKLDNEAKNPFYRIIYEYYDCVKNEMEMIKKNSSVLIGLNKREEMIEKLRKNGINFWDL